MSNNNNVTLIDRYGDNKPAKKGIPFDTKASYAKRYPKIDMIHGSNLTERQAYHFNENKNYTEKEIKQRLYTPEYETYLREKKTGIHEPHGLKNTIKKNIQKYKK